MPAAPRPADERSAAIDRLADGRVDVLVIGAGIAGAATALAATSAGASVAVVDRGDVAGATSSASSKLLHGGLRYLRMGDVWLVRQAHAERRANAEVVAPHLVEPMRFLIPVHDGGPVRLWEVRAGVAAYAALARFAGGRTGRIGLGEALRRVPDLDTSALRGTVAYHDHVTNDARLTLAVLQTAAAHGARVVTRAEVVGLRTDGGRVAGADLLDRIGGRRVPVAARAVVNAAGPWVDEVRRMEDPAAGPSVRLSKGVHVLLRGGDGWTSAVTTPLAGGRVSFAVPWEGMLLLGTTDDRFEGDPRGVAATEVDVERVLAEAATALEPAALAPDRVLSSFAGVRVLPLAGGATSRTRRETIVRRGPGGMVSVAGGKLTTWRAIGIEAAGRALEPLGLPAPDTRPAPLEGAGGLREIEAGLAASHPGLPEDVRANLSRHYGTRAGEVLAAGGNGDGLDRIRPDGPDIWVQVPWAARHEWALTAEDVLLRRTTAGLRGPVRPATLARIERLLA